MSVSVTNFYVVGGTLRRDAECYVQRQADEDLFKGLNEGKFCYVLTARQMGKSSLMVRTAMRLRADGTKVIVLDLTAIGQNLSVEQWYDGLLNQLAQQVNLEDELDDFWVEHKQFGPLQRWMKALCEVVLKRHKEPIVIFIDEIDVVRSLPFTSDEFFAGIRELYNRRTEDPTLNRLSFCLLGVATPSDLIRDTRTTPFNIGQRVELKDFALVEANPLAKGLERGAQLGEQLLDRIFYWTAGHPYLTQRLCQAVAQDSSIDNIDKVDKLCEKMFLTQRAKETDDNLTFVRDRMLRSEVDRVDLLDIYKRVYKHKQVNDDSSNPLINILKLSGIARVENGYLKLRNRIYNQSFGLDWITQNMPDAELRRQRAAFRRGLALSSTVATAILSLIIWLWVDASSQRNDYRKLLYSSQMNLAYQEWNAGNVGRVEELLNSTKGTDFKDLRGFEWDYLNQAPHKELFSLLQPGLVSSIAVSPNGKTLAVAAGDKTIQLWNIVTRNKIGTLSGHNGVVWAVAFSPDGKYIASGGGNQTLKLWDTATQKEIATLNGHTGAIWCLAFSPDSKFLASGSGDNTIKLWDLTTSQEVTTFKGHTNTIWSVAFSPDGKTLASGSWDNTAKIWDLTTKTALTTLNGHLKWVYGVAFSPDGKTLATSSLDKTIILWETQTYQKRSILIGHQAEVMFVAFLSNKILITGSVDTTAKLWDTETCDQIATFKGHRDLINSIAFLPKSSTIITSSFDKTVKFWNLETGPEPAVLNKHNNIILSLAFSLDSQFLATGGKDKRVKIWDINANKELIALEGHTDEINAVAFSPEGKILASGSNDETVRLWNYTTNSELAILRSHTKAVYSLAFSPDSKILASGSADKTIKLWDLSTKQELTVLNGHSELVSSLAFSPDGKILASGSWDKTIILWDTTTKQRLATLTGDMEQISHILFSPDGKTLIAGDRNGFIEFWEVSTQKEVYRFKGHAGTIYSSVTISPDGSRLATSGDDSLVKIWDMKTKQQVATLKDLTGGVFCLEFSPDGKRLAAGGDEKLVKLWSIEKKD